MVVCVVLIRHSLILAFIVGAVSCNLLNDAIEQDADKIIQYLTQGEGKGQTYSWLEHLCDTFGNRYAPGPQFDLAANHLVAELKAIGVDKVWTEPAPNIPHWFRGQDPLAPDHAWLLEPRKLFIPVLALGNSTATPHGTGFQRLKAIVVRSFNELDSISDEKIRGNIVIYNQPWQGYDKSELYRGHGATQAAKKGAVAALIRSVTPQSLYTLHAGWQDYDPSNSSLQIPVASITVEDAELLHRLQMDGHELVLSLVINTTNHGTITKPNIVAEIVGSQFPEQMVLFGGHLDSWDVGQGAMDDGGGVAITFRALATIKKLGLKPKRTVRAVFWTGEEFDYVGSGAYYKSHKQEAANVSLVMESDSGVFKPLGFHFTGEAGNNSLFDQFVNSLILF